MDTNRLLIGIIVALGVMFLYQEFLQWRYPNLYTQKNKQAQTEKLAGQKSPNASGSPAPLSSPVATNNTGRPGNALSTEEAGKPAAGPPPGRAVGSITAAPQRTVQVDTNYYEAILTSRGARLVSFRLKKFRQTDAPNSPLYDVVRAGDRLPMGLVVTRGEATVNDADVDYKTEAPREISASPGESVVVTFTGQTSDGVALRKSYTFKSSAYVFDLDAEASAASGAPVSAIGLTISQPLAELEGYHDYPILQADVNGKALTEAQKALEKGVQPVTGPITYAGFGDRYFLAAFLPQRPTSGTVMMDYQGTEADARLQFNGARSVATQVYMGPKELQALEAVNPSLSKAIDLGFWGVVALPFLRALKFFYRIAPNYGVAIILLTVVVRLLTLPMSIKGQRSMMRMQRLQPQVQRIRDKFKDDQERLNREMVELYKRNHVNPVGGCLPMVIQFPVFIGLYEALLNAVELRHAPFIGWIRDLSAPDCLPIHGMPAIPFTDLHGIPVLVILMTLTAFIQQWISPRNPDPSQQKMMMYMPVMFSLIFIELPAGLSLYYFASNLLGVIQQFILNREFKQYTPVATT